LNQYNQYNHYKKTNMSLRRVVKDDSTKLHVLVT